MYGSVFLEIIQSLDPALLKGKAYMNNETKEYNLISLVSYSHWFIGSELFIIVNDVLLWLMEKQPL